MYLSVSKKDNFAGLKLSFYLYIQEKSLISFFYLMKYQKKLQHLANFTYVLHQATTYGSVIVPMPVIVTSERILITGRNPHDTVGFEVVIPL